MNFLEPKFVFLIDVGLFAAWLTLLSGCCCEYYYILLRSPSTDDCKYSAPVSLSVCQWTILCYTWLPLSPSSFCTPHRSAPAPHCSDLFHLSSLFQLCLLFEMTEAWCIPWIFPIGPRLPSVIFFSLLGNSPQSRKWFFSVAPCLLFLLALWWGDRHFNNFILCVFILFQSLLFAHLCTHLSLSLLVELRPVPPTCYWFVACIRFFPAPQSSYNTVQHCIALYVSADLSCWSVLVWFDVSL